MRAGSAALVVSETDSGPLPNAGHRRQFAGDGYCVVVGIDSSGELGAIESFFKGYREVGVAVFDSGAAIFLGGQLVHGSGPNLTKDRSRRTSIGDYIDQAGTQAAQSGHPVLNKGGEAVTRVDAPNGGGPCEDGWLGALH